MSNKTFWSGGIVGIFLGLVLAPAALAHVRYVVDVDRTLPGTDWSYLLSALREPINLILIVATLAAATALYIGATKARLLRPLFSRMHHQAESYGNLTSWMMRLSLGIALIGAGTHNVLVSPAFPNSLLPLLSAAEVALGFLLLLGFLLAPATWLTVIIYCIVLFYDSYALGNLDFLALALALALTANNWPGLDHILGIPFPSLSVAWHRFVPLILRLGVGVAMVYLAVYEKFLNPLTAAMVVTKYHLASVMPVSPAMWVLSVGTIELLIGAAIVLGWQTRLMAAIAFLVVTSTFFYFGEEVYAHITLFGSLSVLFVTGSGGYSVDALITKFQPRARVKPHRA